MKISSKTNSAPLNGAPNAADKPLAAPLQVTPFDCIYFVLASHPLLGQWMNQVEGMVLRS